MKKIYVSLIALFMACVTLSSCSANLVQLKYEDGMLVNKSANLTYKSLPTSFEPTETLGEYAEYKSGKLVLCEIKDMDPQKWLSEKYEGIASVFCASDIEIPTLSTFQTNKIILCTYDEVTIGIEVFEDEEFINEVVDMFENGEETDWPLIDSKGLYQIKFASDKYPGLYYNLMYGIFEEGTFIYDRYSKKCVDGKNVFDDVIAHSVYTTKD